MADDVLSQDEIDALLNGGDDASPPDTSDNSSVREFDFAEKGRVVSSRMQALYTVNERFVRGFRTTLMNQLRRSVDVSLLGVETKESQEYLSGHKIPTCLNLIRMRPLHGTALIVLPNELVFSLVDILFGGANGYIESKSSNDDREEFTQMELRIAQRMVELMFQDLATAWSSILEVEFEYLNTEINSNLINIVAPKDVFVVTRYRIDLEHAGGEIQMAIPYAMLEPIRAELEADARSLSEEINDNWRENLREEIFDAPIDITGNLATKDMTLRAIARLKKGDILPVELNEIITVLAGGVPIFRAKYGSAKKNRALKIMGRVQRV